MRNIIILACGLALTSMSVKAQQVRFSLEMNRFGVQVYELPPRLDIVSHSHDSNSVDIVGSKELFEHLKSIGMNPKLIEVQKPNVDQAYLTHQEITDYIHRIAQLYPEFVHIEQIGRSIENRPLWAVRLSSKENLHKKPAVLFNAMHHARELMTTEVSTDIIHYIVENAGNIETPEVADWLANLQIWVMPQLNPDGNHVVWTQDSWWRKNARGDGHEIWGVDLNRNYPYRWGACRGSSSDKDNQTYRGTSAASEPETQSMVEFIRKINPVINISYHSYSELVISPYGCKGHTPTEVGIIDYYGKPIANSLVKDSGRGKYTYGPAWDELYPVDGDDASWMHESLNILSYVIEIGSSEQGFQPDYEKWRDSQVARQRPGWMMALNQAMAGPQLRLQIFDARTREPIDAQVRIADQNYMEAEAPRQSRNGFLVKMLTPGIHNLEIRANGYIAETIRVSLGERPEFLNVYLQAN